jgi:hypothetical protein
VSLTSFLRRRVRLGSPKWPRKLSSSCSDSEPSSIECVPHQKRKVVRRHETCLQPPHHSPTHVDTTNTTRGQNCTGGHGHSHHNNSIETFSSCVSILLHLPHMALASK